MKRPTPPGVGHIQIAAPQINRGRRPVAGGAMSSTERSRRHRAKAKAEREGKSK